MKNYVLRNWQKYNLTSSKREMLELLNILQACGESLDSLHDVCLNNYTSFADIFGFWESDKDVVQALYQFNAFYTEEEFIDYILGRITALKEDGYDDPVEEIRTWTFDEEISDTKIVKTDDGYVIRVWY